MARLLAFTTLHAPYKTTDPNTRVSKRKTENNSQIASIIKQETVASATTNMAAVVAFFLKTNLELLEFYLRSLDTVKPSSNSAFKYTHSPIRYNGAIFPLNSTTCLVMLEKLNISKSLRHSFY
jgi:hypothetical protein